MRSTWMTEFRPSSRWACVAVAIAALLLAGLSYAQAPKQGVQPVQLGSVYPAGSYKNLNPRVSEEMVDLSKVIGSKPIVFYYWIPGNPRADEVLQDIQAVVSEAGADNVQFYPIVLLREDRGVEFVHQGVEKLDIKVPILEDPGFEFGQRLRVQSVPNITILDKEGRLRLTNGASLKQELEYKMTLRTAIERVATKGSLGNYGYLGRYYPVNELVGETCPDFKAPFLTTKIEQRWSSLLDDEKINVLIFWSVDCPHCRKSLPELNTWLKNNSEGLNVFSAAKVTSEAVEVRTREFCDLNGFTFPTLMDKDLNIAELYQVTATPTILIIRPDGVIDSVLMSDTDRVARELDKKRRELLNKS
ncbi:TlpA family protein disulfide reductase [bacterium]|nr:TlpA family protein disulfide reductase [bacterium]